MCIQQYIKIYNNTLLFSFKLLIIISTLLGIYEGFLWILVMIQELGGYYNFYGTNVNC